MSLLRENFFILISINFDRKMELFDNSPPFRPRGDYDDRKAGWTSVKQLCSLLQAERDDERRIMLVQEMVIL